MEIWQCLKRLAGVWHFMMFWDCRVFDREMASSWQFRVWSSGYSCWWSTDIWPQLPSERYLDDDHCSSEFLWLLWLWFMMTVAMLMMIYMMVIGKRHAFTFLQKCSWNPWQLAPHLWFHWVKNHHYRGHHDHHYLYLDHHHHHNHRYDSLKTISPGTKLVSQTALLLPERKGWKNYDGVMMMSQAKVCGINPNGQNLKWWFDNCHHHHLHQQLRWWLGFFPFRIIFLHLKHISGWIVCQSQQAGKIYLDGQ